LERLAGFKVPRRIVFTDEIPASDAGKVQRFKLAELLAVSEGAGGPAGRPVDRTPTPMELRLQQIWRQTLDRTDIGLNDNFFLLGGDSLQAVDLFLQIEKELKCRLPVAALFEAGTIAEMASLIEDEKPQGCIVPIRTTGDKKPFFCVHGASGQVIGFYGLAKHLGEDQPFYGIQSIGWDRSAPPFTRTWDMAGHYVKELRKIQPQGPYYLGGYSFGGRVAVYMANLLKEAGEEIGLLAIIDSSLGTGARFIGFRQWLMRSDAPPGSAKIGAAIKYGWFRVRKSYDELYDRFRRVGVFKVRELYRARGKKVPLFMCRPDRLNSLIRIEQRNMPSFKGDAVYFRTEIPDRSMAHPDTKDQWASIVEGALETVPMPGTHEQVIQEPVVRELAKELGARLRKHQGD
jgi:thioesterase domain-containing protein/acyl carrier protein